MLPSKDNLFNRHKNDGVQDAVAKIMKNTTDKYNELPDKIRSAAKAAGTELRGAGERIPVETKNTIYNKHFNGAVGDNPVDSHTRGNFERLADQEWTAPPPPSE
jgi:hypothetical protein